MPETLKDLLTKPLKDGAKRFLVDEAIMKAATPAGRWRLCTDAEIAEALPALAKLIGKESKLPSWQRRLGVLLDKPGEWVLSIEALGPSWVEWLPHYPTAAITIAVPLAVGVSILMSPNSPEVEFKRRRDLHEAYRNAESEKARIAAAKRDAEIAETQRKDNERQQFRAAAWEQLSALERCAARLALLVGERDPQLATDIRAAIAGAGDTKNFPRTVWWKNMEGATGLQAAAAKEEQQATFARRQRAEGILSHIPAKTRWILEVQHGQDNVEAQLAAWEQLQAQQAKADKQNGRAA